MRKHRFQGITTDYAHRYGTDAVDFIRTCFYVDDGLCSVDNENRALNLIQRSIAMCKEGGVELAKFVSSSSHVTKNLVSRDHSLVWSKINIDFLAPVNESSLGVNWNVNDDSFFYSTQTPPEIYTRRKVLSVIASVFDSMGLVSLFFFLGKQILQQACICGLNWDDSLPDNLQKLYKNWCSQLKELSSIVIPRCVKPLDFERQTVEFHHFADASSHGYGICSYLRLIGSDGHVSVSLVFAKSGVSDQSGHGSAPRINRCCPCCPLQLCDVRKGI